MSCFGLCGSDESDDLERQPLLPKYNDDTAREERLHEKLHTYQMLKAFSKCYLPSNKQAIVHLRTLLSAGILNPSDGAGLSTSGRALVRTIKVFIKQLITLLENKNSKNQLQDFVWYLRKANLDVDAGAVKDTIVKGKGKADAKATIESLNTVFSIALLNKDFRVFVADLGTISKQVLRDATSALGDASKEVSKELDQDGGDAEALKATDKSKDAPETIEAIKEQSKDLADNVREDVANAANEAYSSVEEHTSGESRRILISRLKKAVTGLRKTPDYSDSVSALSMLLKRYLNMYLAVGVDAANTLEDNVESNEQAHEAAREFWQFMVQFGDKEKWDAVKKSFEKLVEENKSDENLEGLVDKLGNTLQSILSDPEFFDNIENNLKDLRTEVNDISADTTIGQDAGDVLNALQEALLAAVDDKDVQNLKETSLRLINILFPSGEAFNTDLVSDSANLFLPLMVQAVQYIPIPRVEVSTPAIDLLLENLVLEPGKTVNNSSFLPFKLQVQTRNDVDVTKARFGMRSSLTSLLTVKIAGLSIAAEDLGYWFKLHSGILRMTDEGLGSFHLDKRGIDITLDVELGRDNLENLVSLRNVDVKIHHLNYTLGKSKFACLAWLFKPLIRPIVRKSLESKISSSIGDGLVFFNRELVFARERLRATRICGPTDVWTFVRAVAARLVPEDDPDINARVGVQPGEGVFKGRYAPGSLVKLWEEEARDADQNVFEYRRDGWKNAIFDVKTAPTE